jgi:hypothetical protein
MVRETLNMPAIPWRLWSVPMSSRACQSAIDVFGKRAEFNSVLLELVEHGYQVAQALVVAPERPSSLNTVLHPAFFKAASCRAGVWSSVDIRA